MTQSSRSYTFARNLGLDPIVAAGLTAAVLFFIVSGAIAYSNLQGLRTGNQNIVHTHDVITGLQEILSNVKDAETGQRGFLLTDDRAYLVPYEQALVAIPRTLARLEDLTNDNRAQRSQLEILRQHIAAKLDELKETIEVRREQGLNAALALVSSDRGKAEMDAIRSSIDEMIRGERELRVRRFAEMDASYRTALTSAFLSALVGFLLTVIIGVIVRKGTMARRREAWLQAGYADLATAMIGDQETDELGGNILGFLARYADAVAGALFVGDGKSFRRVSTYGVPEDAKVPTAFKLGESLLGQAALESRAIVVEDVPDGYLAFGSALGHEKPRHLVISPGNVDGTVNAVLELGFLQPADEKVRELLDQASSSIAVAVRSAKYRGELRELLEETQRQSDELQTQSEELRVSNEELEEQGRALRESQARLEQQQVELEQTNSQLEEQTQMLEAHRDDLERANASVQLKARELEQASRYKTDFLANMSHELRTPLNSSLILAKLLADNTDDNLTEEQVNYARTIQASGNDLLNLINDILDLSKIEAGHVQVTPEDVSIDGLSKTLGQLFRPVAEDRNLEFKIEIDAGCPETIETDGQRLEQILKNLLSNAFKFTQSGTVTLAFRRSGRDEMEFSVSDTGIGISEDQQRSVFDAFHQADSTISRKYGGTGLGLSISRELVRLLGGRIHLESKQGEGSVFTLTVPVAYDPAKVAPRNDRRPMQATPPIAPVEQEMSTPPRARSGKLTDDRGQPSDSKRSLLVIEDDHSFAAIVRDLSRELGFRVLVADTAEEALALAKQQLPSAIVLDVGLPDQSGLSVLDRLKRDVKTRHIPIHMVSANDHIETALSLGAVGYMLKPVKREQLVEVLKKLEAKLAQRMRRVLIVEDDQVQRDAVAKLLSSQEVETITAGTASECLELLQAQTFDCMVLDLTLPDASGYSLLETLSKEEAYAFPPVIVYTGRELSPDEEQRLRKYSKSIIIKGAKSPERLLDEVTLFLHQVVSELPVEQQKMIRKARNRDAVLEGRRVLVVEDDVRNVYALTNVLEPRGVVIDIARNGKEALEALEKSAKGGSPIDLVLMDVMMPIMDGLTATREIRKNADWKKLPIIALTAKAMPDDQKRCIDAGANDYMAKPLDVEKLLSLVRVWMPR